MRTKLLMQQELRIRVDGVLSGKTLGGSGAWVRREIKISLLPMEAQVVGDAAAEIEALARVAAGQVGLRHGLGMDGIRGLHSGACSSPDL